MNFKVKQVASSFVQYLFVHNIVLINLLFWLSECIVLSSKLILKVSTCITFVSTKIA